MLKQRRIHRNAAIAAVIILIVLTALALVASRSAAAPIARPATGTEPGLDLQTRPNGSNEVTATAANRNVKYPIDK
jgi:hypothetical protein